MRKPKEKENLLTKMGNIMKGNGKMDLSMEKVKYIIKMEILNMKEILSMINMKATENILWKMGKVI